MAWEPRDVKDQVVQHPNRFLVDGVPRTIVPDFGEVTEAGTLVNRAYLKPMEDYLGTIMTGTTGALYGATTPDEVLAALNVRTQNSLLRDLNIMLNLSLGTSNIDAWADLLSDATQINAGSSSGYTLSGGKITSNSAVISQDTALADMALGANTTYVKLGQTFTATLTGKAKYITVKLIRYGSPSDNITAKVYASDKATLLATSDTTIVGNTVSSGGYTQCQFNFSNLSVINGSVYFIVIERTGGLDATNYYRMSLNEGSNLYAGGSAFRYTSTSSEWIAVNYDFAFSVSLSSDAVVVWNAVAATEPLFFAAVTADKTLGTGSITFYLSDNGISWTEVAALDTMQQVNFDAAALYLKCVLTGNATVSAVAWGGY